MQQKQKATNNILLKVNIGLDICWHLYDFMFCSLNDFLSSYYVNMNDNRLEKFGKRAMHTVCKDEREAKETFNRSYLVIKIWATQANEKGKHIPETE